MGEETKGDWYSNKELYEMMLELSKGLERTNAELSKTQVLIRDYNGLREDVVELKSMVAQHHTKCSIKEETKKDNRLNIYQVITWLIAFTAIIVALIRKGSS